MKVATKEQLPDDEWRLYEYITRHFIASLSGDCTYKEIVVTFDIGGETFFLTGIFCTLHLIHSFLCSLIF
jgi:DNA topoisomerase-3